MPYENHNVPTVESVPNNDDATLSSQQCNNINTPSLPPITHEDYNETTENSLDRIPVISCKCIVNQILSYKELIITKEQEELYDFFCTMNRKRGNNETCLKHCESVH